MSEASCSNCGCDILMVQPVNIRHCYSCGHQQLAHNSVTTRGMGETKPKTTVVVILSDADQKWFEEAAPDLLGALEKMVDAFGAFGGDAIQSALAAIAKAKGDQP